MTSSEERAHIKRAMGIGEYPDKTGYWEILPGATRWYIYVDGQKYEATWGKDRFYARVEDWLVAEETLEKLRDRAIEVVEMCRLKQRIIGGFGFDCMVEVQGGRYYVTAYSTPKITSIAPTINEAFDMLERELRFQINAGVIIPQA